MSKFSVHTGSSTSNKPVFAGASRLCSNFGFICISIDLAKVSKGKLLKNFFENNKSHYFEKFWENTYLYSKVNKLATRAKFTVMVTDIFHFSNAVRHMPGYTYHYVTKNTQKFDPRPLQFTVYVFKSKINTPKNACALPFTEALQYSRSLIHAKSKSF